MTGGNISEISTVLILRRRIGDKLAVAFAEGLGKLTAQRIDPSAVHIANNCLTEHGSVAISQAVSKLQHLTLLDMSENHLGKSGAAALARALLSHEQLQTLRLGATTALSFSFVVQNLHATK
eukprot:SAG31_NODE_3136_length_4636_cov_1.969583_3_plen_122_part_00